MGLKRKHVCVKRTQISNSMLPELECYASDVQVTAWIQLRLGIHRHGLRASEVSSILAFETRVWFSAKAGTGERMGAGLAMR